MEKRKIAKSHVLVIGSGPSTAKYWDKIEKFIEEHNPITFGCNNIMDFLTAEQLINLDAKNHVVAIYPRKHQVCIDGFKYYKVNSGTLSKYKYYKKTGFLVS